MYSVGVGEADVERVGGVSSYQPTDQLSAITERLAAVLEHEYIRVGRTVRSLRLVIAKPIDGSRRGYYEPR